MKVKFDLKSDYFIFKDDEDFFEWNYFEVDFLHNSDHYNLVIIGFNGCPFTPDFYEKRTRPTINLAITKNNIIISFALHNYSSFQSNTSRLKIGNGMEIKYMPDGVRKICIDMHDIYNQKILINLTFVPKIIVKHMNDAFGAEDTLTWGIHAMSYKVFGDIKIQEFEHKINTYGYHDYNSGNLKNLIENVENWCWAKYSAEKNCTAYFSLRYANSYANYVIIYDGEKVNIYKNFEEKKKYKFTKLFLSYVACIRYNLLGKNFTIKAKKPLDFSYLGLSGILYTRRSADYKIKNKTYSSTLEYIKPKRIKSKLIRFMINYGLKHTKQKYEK